MASSTKPILNQSACLVPPGAPSVAEYHPPTWLHPDLETHAIVDYSPSEIVRRHSSAWSGLQVETVQVVSHTPFAYVFPAPCHLLIATQLPERYDRATLVDCLPQSTLRNFSGNMSFAPA